MPKTIYEKNLAENNKLTDYGRKIVEENLWTVQYVINRFFSSTEAEKEELQSIGNEALVKAAVKFDIKREIKFDTFAISCIKSALCVYFRYFNKDKAFMRKRVKIIDEKEKKKEEEAEEGNLISIEQGYKMIEIEDEFARTISAILNFLRGNKRRVLLYIMGGLTQKEVATNLGITHQRISKINEAARKELKIAMQKTAEKEKIFYFEVINHKFILRIFLKDKHFQKELCKLFDIANEFHVEKRQDKIIIKLSSIESSFLFLANIMSKVENMLIAFGVESSEKRKK